MTQLVERVRSWRHQCADPRLDNGAIPAGTLFAFRPTLR
jgi:hypothetical protein